MLMPPQRQCLASGIHLPVPVSVHMQGCAGVLFQVAYGKILQLAVYTLVCDVRDILALVLEC